MSYDSPPQKFRRWRRAKRIEKEDAIDGEVWGDLLLAMTDYDGAGGVEGDRQAIAEHRERIVAIARRWLRFPPEAA